MFIFDDALDDQSRDRFRHWVRDSTGILAVPVAVIGFTLEEVERLPPDHLRLAIEAAFGSLL